MEIITTLPTVLWVDDDVDDLMMIGHVLDDMGHKVNLVEAGNGKEAAQQQIVRRDVGCAPEFGPSNREL